MATIESVNQHHPGGLRLRLRPIGLALRGASPPRLSRGGSRHSHFPSELVSQRELHFARRRGLLKLTKRERCGEREAGIGKVHGVERIESLGSEANALAFLRKPERFLQRQIRIEVRREPHRRFHSRMPG